MANLGSFGAAVREADPRAEKDTFEFCGEQFEVKGEIPPMLMLQLGAAASEKIEQTEGMAALWEAMRCSLTKPATAEIKQDPDSESGELVTVRTPEDASEFQRFYKLAVASLVRLEDLIALAMALFEAQAGRPTGQQPASLGGPLPTSPSSSTSPSASQDWPGMTPVKEVLAG